MRTTLTSLALLLLATTGSLAVAQTPARARATPPLPPVLALPVASDEQKEVATRVHTGLVSCELGQSVKVTGHPTAVGYLDVLFGRQAFVMKPVQSQTGAIRLEDVKGVALMLQLGNKSMLMNVQSGQRLADECVHPIQREAALAAARAAAEARARGETAPSLFGTSTVTVTPTMVAPTATPAVTATAPVPVAATTTTVATPALPASVTPSAVLSPVPPQPANPPLNLSIPR